MYQNVEYVANETFRECVNIKYLNLSLKYIKFLIQAVTREIQNLTGDVNNCSYLGLKDTSFASG